MSDETSTESEEYVCEYCGKKFSTPQALASHKKYKHGYSPRKSAIEHDRQLETGIAADSESDIADVLMLDEDDMTSLKRTSHKIGLEPEVHILYTYAVTNGFKGDLSDFVNACVINYMRRAAGVEVVLVQRKNEEEVDEEWLS